MLQTESQNQNSSEEQTQSEVTKDLEQLPTQSPEVAPEPNEEKFNYGSLEEIKNTIGLDFSNWEKKAESLGGDVLKKGGKELLFVNEQGQKISTTEQVKGSALESSHMEILDALYTQGFAVKEFTNGGLKGSSRELHIYFANEKGQVSYEIYNFQENIREEITYSDSPLTEAVREPVQNEDAPPTSEEPTIISLDEALIDLQDEQVTEQSFTDFIIQKNEFNFQNYFEAREPQIIELQTKPLEAERPQNNKPLVEQPRQELVQHTEAKEHNLTIPSHITIKAAAETPTEQPQQNPVVAEPVLVNNYPALKIEAEKEKIDDKIIELVINNPELPATSFNEKVQTPPKKESEQTILKKTTFIAEILRPKIDLRQEIIAANEPEKVNKIKAEPEREQVQNLPRLVTQRLAPVVKFYHTEEPKSPTPLETQTPTPKIEAVKEITTKHEPRNVNTAKAEPQPEYVQRIFEKPSLEIVEKTVPAAQPHRQEIAPSQRDKNEPVIRNETQETKPASILEVKAKVPVERSPIRLLPKTSAFKEKPASKIDIRPEIIVKDEASVVKPRTIVEILQKITNPSAGGQPRFFYQPARAEQFALQEIIKLSAAAKKMTVPFLAKDPIIQNSRENKETPARRAIPIDQTIVDEKNPGSNNKAQAIKITT